MKLKDVIQQIEEIFTIPQAEDFDNVGLLCGNPENAVSGILVCHDALEKVIDEAIKKGAKVLLVNSDLYHTYSDLEDIVVLNHASPSELYGRFCARFYKFASVGKSNFHYSFPYFYLNILRRNLMRMGALIIYHNGLIIH